MARPKYVFDFGGDGEVLEAYIACRARVSMIMGPLGSGKTFGSLQRILQHQAEQEPNAEKCRPTRFYAVRNTYPELMTTTVKDFDEVFNGISRIKTGGLGPPTALCEYDLGDGTWVWSEVVFLALDRADAVRRLRGSQPTAFWLNEVKELSLDVVRMCNGRIGRFPKPIARGVDWTWRGMFGDCNAPDVDDWYYQLAEKRRPKNWKFFRQPGGVIDAGTKPDGMTRWEPNPDAENLSNLDRGYYIEQVEMAFDEGGDSWIRVNLANEYGFVVDGKPIHPAFKTHLHVVSEGIPFNPAWPLYTGADYGRTPAVVLAQYDEAKGRVLVIGEVVTSDDSRQSAELFAPQVLQIITSSYRNEVGEPPEIRGWGDPAGDAGGQAREDTPRDIMRANGIPIDSAPSNVFALRTSALDRALTRNGIDGKPGIQISGPSCPRLVKALMGGYQYRRMKVAGDARYTDEPDKNAHSHVAEALHYLMLGLGFGKEVTRRKPQGRRRLPTRAVLR